VTAYHASTQELPGSSELFLLHILGWAPSMYRWGSFVFWGWLIKVNATFRILFVLSEQIFFILAV
jgi:hypothetical protein